MDDALISAIATVPASAWAVGVSGGADSVALLQLLHARPDVSLHIVHLDHQTRGDESTLDAQFVAALCAELEIDCTVALRSDVEAGMGTLRANVSSRYRAARISLFGNVVAERKLAGVILAHHADDQAETVMLRLLRGSGPMGLAGMEPVSQMGDLTILRPLLRVRRDLLRAYLAKLNQAWREDASNASDDYLRNRVRRWMECQPGLSGDLLELADASRCVRDWVRSVAPRLERAFHVRQIAELPSIVAGESARRWLVERGAPADEITPDSIARLLQMVRDAGSASRSHFPGKLLVSRSKGVIAAE